MERRPQKQTRATCLLLPHFAALAAEHGLHSIAFPAISTGIYRFPPDLAARIAVGTVAAEMTNSRRGLQRVVFCCFSPESAEHHRNAFRELGLI
jgi:O-acetyl-ADP-ribose deacetylase (regulator of RNase III)